MTIDEIVHGEPKNIEFKITLPEKSANYIKTVIAFANTQGGRLVIGVEDNTNNVVGVNRDTVFQLMDSIENAISDSCEPQIVPDIEAQTLEGKTLVVVTVTPGPNRPYYLKSKGKEAGTYIRVAGTTRPAFPEKIKELEMEGMRLSWDELACADYRATEESVNKLCADIMKYRIEAGLPVHDVTEKQLVNWKLLKKTRKGYAATNAFVLLTSDHFPFSKTQCAVFKGKDRSVFIDKREYSGPLYEQIGNAAAFVFRNIRLGARVEGLIRKETYELPEEAIREMIINAHCHRSFSDESCIQIALFDDRLEVTSPGGLYNGITYEEIMSGHSKIRNRVIADVFNQMGLVEAWGTGIKRIITAAAKWDLPVPEFQEFDNMFRVELFRDAGEKHYNGGDNGGDGGDNGGDLGGNSKNAFLSQNEQTVLNTIECNAAFTVEKIAEFSGLSKRTAERAIKKLKEKSIIRREGSDRSGFWKILKH